MLLALSVKNVVLMEDVTIELEPGLNVMTGETGAGKSALVGALSLLLGQRGGKEWVRKGARAAEVNAVFTSAAAASEAAPTVPGTGAGEEVLRLLEEAGIEAEDTLVLRRLVQTDGRGRAYINAVPAPLKLLREVAERLFSVTSQHEHYRLLDPRSHVAYLDRFGDLETAAASVAELYRRQRSVSARISALEQAAQDQTDRMELMRFQAAEIDEVDPRPGESEELEARSQRLQNVESLMQLARQGIATLYEDDDGSVHGRLGILSAAFRRGVDMDQSLAGVGARVEALSDEVQELSRDLERYFDSLDANPEALAEVEERLDALNKLRFKYGRGLVDVLETRARIREALDEASAEDQALGALQEERLALWRQLREEAKGLSARRSEAATRMEDAVREALGRLQMENVGFRVSLEAFKAPETREEHATATVETELGAPLVGEEGAERVSFLVETNPQEGFHPLRAIVSGGELSRILLALKRVLLDAERVPLHLFDEIDVGLSQGVALKVGDLLREVSERAQVIVITHQPHIARFADHHLLVEKGLQAAEDLVGNAPGGNGSDEARRQVTRVRSLSGPERVQELARMLGGDDAGVPVHEQAKLLLGSSGAQQEISS